MASSGIESGTHPLHSVFTPDSIAIVGASADPAKRGHQILRALGESGYRGAVYPVNPRGGSLMGYQVFPSVRSLPHAVDLAVLCTPAHTVPGLLEECGERGVGAALVLAVGFKESGEEGEALERKVAEAAEANDVRVVGPNTSGLLNMHAGVNLIGARGVRPGSLALLVQSGNMALALMNEVTAKTWEGISLCVGVGNETDVGFAETLEYLGDHEDTRAVIVYAEGFTQPRRVLEVATEVSRSKPVIVLKAARSESGARSALSHTGAIAGPYDRLVAGFEQAGVVSIVRTDELTHVAESLANQPPARPGSGIAILSDGGGQGTLVVDTLSELGVPLAVLSETIRTKLSELLGPAAAVGNPVDLAGAADADPLAFARALRVLAADPEVGGVLVVGLFGGYGIRFAESLTRAEIDAGHEMAEIMRRLAKPLVVHSMYAASRSAPLEALGSAGVPVIESLDVACRSIAELQRRGERIERRTWPPVAGARATRRVGAHDEIVRAAAMAGRTALTEPEVRRVLEGYGVAFGPSVTVDSADEAARAVQGFAARCAMKVVSEHILHKSDAGGVVLGVSGAEEARATFELITDRAAAYTRDRGAPDDRPGVLVTPMETPPVTELLVGAYRDPGLGPVITIGTGGVFVEVFTDTSQRVLPVDADELRAAIEELKVRPILDGARGGEKVHREPIIAVASAVAASIEALEEIAEIEINPLFVYPDRVSPIDARIVLERR